jgi:hypothetical protein
LIKYIEISGTTPNYFYTEAVFLLTDKARFWGVKKGINELSRGRTGWNNVEAI